MVLQLEAFFAARDRDQAKQRVETKKTKRRKVSLLSFQGSDEKGRENANSENAGWSAWRCRALLALPVRDYFAA